MNFQRFKLAAVAALLCQALVAQAGTTENLVTNGDFSSTFTRPNGTLNGKPPFMPGATGWQIPLSNWEGVKDGALYFQANFQAGANRPGVNYAYQTFQGMSAGKYLLSFDYSFVGRDPYVTGDGLKVVVGGWEWSLPWKDQASGTAQYRFLLGEPPTGITFSTTLAQKPMQMGVLPDPKAYVTVDNVKLVRVTTPVDEPPLLAMLAAGLGVLGFLQYKRGK